MHTESLLVVLVGLLANAVVVGSAFARSFYWAGQLRARLDRVEEELSRVRERLSRIDA